MSSSNKINIRALLAIIGVFGGCAVNMVFLELAVKAEPGIGSLVTFLQFAFISVYGFIFTSKFGTMKRKVSYRDYIMLVFLFYSANVLNNIVFDYNIPVPLHMIFRSGSLIANMILGIILLKKRYKLSKYLSVLMITIGISICTIVSAGNKTKSCSNCEDVTQTDQTALNEQETRWILGISILTVALFISAFLGMYQEYLSKNYGKNPNELVYYTHLLSLPGFLFLYQNIFEYIIISNNSAPLNVPILNIGLPELWIYALGNVVTQYICITSVYILSSECSSLTVTLVITLRKFFSLLFSIVYFKNPFTLAHWIGTVLVFGGTFIFIELKQKIQESLASKQKTKVQ